MRYTKYKNFVKISCFGLNDVWRVRSESQYKTPGSNFINGKTCRFNFNGTLNDVILSNNARLILESAYFPTVANVGGYVNIRIVTSTEDKVFDSAKRLSKLDLKPFILVSNSAGVISVYSIFTSKYCPALKL